MDDDVDDVPLVTNADTYSYREVDGRVWVFGIVVALLIFLAYLFFTWLFG